MKLRVTSKVLLVCVGFFCFACSSEETSSFKGNAGTSEQAKEIESSNAVAISQVNESEPEAVKQEPTEDSYSEPGVIEVDSVLEANPYGNEPPAEDPVMEEPIAEDPVMEEPIAEEPVMEEPVVEEPVVDETPVKEEKLDIKMICADDSNASIDDVVTIKGQNTNVTLTENSVVLLIVSSDVELSLNSEDVAKIKGLCIETTGSPMVFVDLMLPVKQMNYYGRGEADTTINFGETGTLEGLTTDVGGSNSLNVVGASVECSAISVVRGGSGTITCNGMQL